MAVSYLVLGFVLIFSVSFETNLFVSVVSKRIRNTETNRKNNSLVSRNKPKINRNRLCFGLFRFEPKKKFVCFEDTLIVDFWLSFKKIKKKHGSAQVRLIVTSLVKIVTNHLQLSLCNKKTETTQLFKHEEWCNRCNYFGAQETVTM
jgi:hypothetical protein